MMSSTGAMGEWVIRELAEADLDAVASLEARINPQPWSRQLFAEELALPPGNRHWLVAVGRGSDREPRPESASESGLGPEPGSQALLVGFGGVMYAPDAAHLMLVGVEPDVTRRGIAVRLCASLFLEAKARGAEGVTLEVRRSNRAAIALYGKLGMTSVGCRPGYYPDGEDAEIFWLHDLQSAEAVDLLTCLAERPADVTTPNPEGPRP